MLRDIFFQKKPRYGVLWGSFVGVLLVTLLLVACGDSTVTSPPIATTAPATTAAPTTAPATTSVATTAAPTSASTTSAATPGGSAGSSIPTEIKPSYDLAVSDLVKQVNVQPNAVQFVSYSREEFSDSSMGCPQPDRSYTQVITPGYRLQLEVGGQLYDYRSNLAGTRVFLCKNPTGGLPVPPKKP